MEWPGRDGFSDGLPVMGCIRAGRNNPCGKKEEDRDETGRLK